MLWKEGAYRQINEMFSNKKCLLFFTQYVYYLLSFIEVRSDIVDYGEFLLKT